MSKLCGDATLKFVSQQYLLALPEATGAGAESGCSRPAPGILGIGSKAIVPLEVEADGTILPERLGRTLDAVNTATDINHIKELVGCIRTTSVELQAR